MTVYRDAELLRTIRRAAGRITVHGYRTREQRDRATLAADALADLLDLLDLEHSRSSAPTVLAEGDAAGPVSAGASQREYSRPTAPPKGSATSGGTRAPLRDPERAERIRRRLEAAEHARLAEQLATAARQVGLAARQRVEQLRARAERAGSREER